MMDGRQFSKREHLIVSDQAILGNTPICTYFHRSHDFSEVQQNASMAQISRAKVAKCYLVLRIYLSEGAGRSSFLTVPRDCLGES